jgi:hypothetical protein
MIWICFYLLLANLAHTELSLWNQSARMLGATENIGNSAFKNSISNSSGLEEKGTGILLAREISESRMKAFEEDILWQPGLTAAKDELNFCIALGPFENVISAQIAVKRLQTMGYIVELTSVDTPTGESDYRVVMPPLSSQQEAFRRHRELKSHGIDSFVITEGLDARGISLGVFSTNGPAENYRLALAGLGYEVLLDVLPRVNRGYWVQISAGMFSEELVLEVTSQFIEVDVAETGCMN